MLVGDPIVIQGHKYRLVDVLSDGQTLILSEPPKRRPTHSVVVKGRPCWDPKAGVWRAEVLRPVYALSSSSLARKR